MRCIIAVNDTNGTFWFHQIRSGESWHSPDLDAHREDKMIVVDIKPSRPCEAERRPRVGAKKR